MKTQPEPVDVETDPRFPSGPWTGYFLQKPIPGRHLMELLLTFRAGWISGEGRDWVGPFTISGRYNLADGRCWWVKQYLRRHAVHYQGFNEGKGIWGTWEIHIEEVAREYRQGGFHIWPEGLRVEDEPDLRAEADAPLEEEPIEVKEPAVMPAY